MYCDQRSQYIRLNSKKNSFRGNYSRKYGRLKKTIVCTAVLRKELRRSQLWITRGRQQFQSLKKKLRRRIEYSLFTFFHDSWLYDVKFSAQFFQLYFHCIVCSIPHETRVRSKLLESSYMTNFLKTRLGFDLELRFPSPKYNGPKRVLNYIHIFLNLQAFWFPEKIELHKIFVQGTVLYYWLN